MKTKIALLLLLTLLLGCVSNKQEAYLEIDVTVPIVGMKIVRIKLGGKNEQKFVPDTVNKSDSNVGRMQRTRHAKQRSNDGGA